MTQINQVYKRKLVVLTKKYLIPVDLLKTDNVKISEIECQILGISGLAVTATLTTVKNNVPNVNLV